MGDEHRELIQFVDRRAGDAFRAAFSYTAEDWTALYLRDDVATGDLHAAMETLHGRARDHEPIVQGEYERLGEAQATVELYEGGVLLHFPGGQSSGVVLSLDRNAARDLAGFVDECHRALREQ